MIDRGIVYEIKEIDESINNIYIEIGNSVDNLLNINIFKGKWERCKNIINNMCKIHNKKTYITYHHDDMTMYVENDTNYVMKTDIKYYHNDKNFNIYLHDETIQDNIMFPNLDKYQNIITHDEIIYKFIIKNFNIPVYIYFDHIIEQNKCESYIIYLKTTLNFQQLDIGFDKINYLLNILLN